MPFWSSLIYTGTRVGGQRERQTQAYEAGTPYFPRDFPSSPAYEEYAIQRESGEREKWINKPSAKRVNYQKLGIHSPWRASWDVVLGLKETVPLVGLKKEDKEATEEESIEKFISTQRDDQMDVDMGGDGDGHGNRNVQTLDASMIDVDEPVLKPWLFRGPEITGILAKLRMDPTTNLLKEINKLRQKRSLEPLSSLISANDFFSHALVNVKVVMFKKGVPGDMATICRVSDEEAETWERLMQGGKMLEGNNVPSALQVSRCPVQLPPTDKVCVAS